MKFKIIFMILLILSMNIRAQTQSENKNYQEMLKTEYAFSQRAGEVGTRDSFLEFIADGGILFRPGPVNGKEFLQKSKYRPGLLSWYPSAALISASGDIGFTTGPWEFKNKAEDSTALYFGNFCTVWKKQDDGKWKFLIDFGNSNAKPEIPEKPLSPEAIKKSVFENAKKPFDENELIAVDSSLNLKNITDFLSTSTRFLRDEYHPIIGHDAIRDYFLKENTKSLSCLPDDSMISSAGDFGFTYGKMQVISQAGDLKEFYYMRVWTRPNGLSWKILADVSSEIKK